jgi:hypothetical protein
LSVLGRCWAPPAQVLATVFQDAATTECVTASTSIITTAWLQIHDTLGLIANAHSALADQHPEGARAEECTSLALKHAEAVDYAKVWEARSRGCRSGLSSDQAPVASESHVTSVITSGLCSRYVTTSVGSPLPLADLQACAADRGQPP